MLTGSEINSSCLADFGQAAILSDGLISFAANVIYEVTGFDAMGMSTDKPQITIETALLDNLDIRQTVVTISGVDYRLLKPLADGHGMSTVTLTGLTHVLAGTHSAGVPDRAIPDAPNDGQIYVRRNGVWEVLSIA